MTGPTDKEIFGHMAQKEYVCGNCGYETVDCGCDFEPEPPGEDDE